MPLPKNSSNHNNDKNNDNNNNSNNTKNNNDNNNNNLDGPVSKHCQAVLPSPEHWPSCSKL